MEPMKNFYKTSISVFLLSFVISCSTKNNIVNTNKPLTTENLTFIAVEANQDAYNYKMEDLGRTEGNSWDNPPPVRDRQYFVKSTSQRLDSGYNIKVTKNELEVNLPFFGELSKWTTTPSRTMQYASADRGVIQFISTDFTMDQKNSKKGKTTLTILAKDNDNPIKIKMEVFANGKTYVEVYPGTRKSSSFEGYIKNNVIAKN